MSMKFTFRFSDQKITENLKSQGITRENNPLFQKLFESYKKSTRIKIKLNQSQQAENIIDMLRAGYIIESMEPAEDN